MKEILDEEKKPLRNRVAPVGTHDRKGEENTSSISKLAGVSPAR